MGITSAEVAFPHRAPSLSDICTKATEICSLPVVVLESHTDKLLELDASIAFECAQDRPLELFTYRQGSVAGFLGVRELRERLRKAKSRMRRLGWTLILMLPVLIPLYAVVLVWDLVTTPFRRRHRLR